MATDHHQSAFDQDKYDRYDTFDDVVAGTDEPARKGFFGDLSRLIDQIRVNNAASKLADNVAIGEDRALNGTGNWAAVPHEELYASVHTNNNPAEAYALSREWTQLGNMMAENSRVMDETIRGTESGWTGPAAEVARQATLKLATWGGDAAQTSQYMGTRIADQGLAAERAKAAMPEPKNFDYEGILRQGFASGGLVGLAQAVQDVQVKSAEARSAHQQAAQVMADMEAQSKTVDETTPRFVRPPETTNDGATMQNTLMGRSMPTAATPAQPLMARLPGEPGMAADRLAMTGSDAGGPLAATAGGSGMPGATTAAFAGAGGGGGAAGGVPNIPTGGGGGGATPDFGAMAAGLTGGGSSGQRGGGSYTPPNITVPDIPMGTTTSAGYSPSDSNLPLGGHPGGTNYGGPTYRPGGGFDPTNLLPPGLTGRDGGGGGDTSYTPGKINPVTGLPFTPEEIRRGLPTTLRGGMPGIPGISGGGAGGFGGGGSGGFGGGGAGGMGGGAAGFGRGGMPGMGQSVGAVAAAEQAAARNAASAAMAGQPGANGQPGMGGAGHGAGRSGGGDDKEHRNKYASNEKIVEEPGRMVPSVIGEKSAKQLKEEQGG